MPKFKWKNRYEKLSKGVFWDVELHIHDHVTMLSKPWLSIRNSIEAQIKPEIEARIYWIPYAE